MSCVLVAGTGSFHDLYNHPFVSLPVYAFELIQDESIVLSNRPVTLSGSRHTANSLLTLGFPVHAP